MIKHLPPVLDGDIKRSDLRSDVWSQLNLRVDLWVAGGTVR